MLRNLTAVFEPADEGGYVCWFEEFPEAMSQGETIQEAQANLLDALEEVLKYRREEASRRINSVNKKSGKEKIKFKSIAV